MKYLFVSMLALGFYSCEKSATDCIDVPFDQPFEAGINDEFCFPDGLTLKILRLDDQRCPCDVECVWQGMIDVAVYALKDGKDDLIHVNNESDTVPQDTLEAYILDFSDYIIKGKDCAPVSEDKIKAVLTVSRR